MCPCYCYRSSCLFSSGLAAEAGTVMVVVILPRNQNNLCCMIFFTGSCYFYSLQFVLSLKVIYHPPLTSRGAFFGLDFVLPK